MRSFCDWNHLHGIINFLFDWSFSVVSGILIFKPYCTDTYVYADICGACEGSRNNLIETSACLLDRH